MELDCKAILPYICKALHAAVVDIDVGNLCHSGVHSVGHHGVAVILGGDKV